MYLRGHIKLPPNFPIRDQRTDPSILHPGGVAGWTRHFRRPSLFIGLSFHALIGSSGRGRILIGQLPDVAGGVISPRPALGHYVISRRRSDEARDPQRNLEGFRADLFLATTALTATMAGAVPAPGLPGAGGPVVPGPGAGLPGKSGEERLKEMEAEMAL